jgi:hypothetical protein
MVVAIQASLYRNTPLSDGRTGYGQVVPLCRLILLGENLSILALRVLSYQIELDITTGRSANRTTFIFGWMVISYRHGLTWASKMVKIYITTENIWFQDIDIRFMRQHLTTIILALCGWHYLLCALIGIIVMVMFIIIMIMSVTGSISDRPIVNFVI